MLKRFASRVVLAFDADAAGQGAAERFYEWEQKYQVQVSVAALPEGPGPGRAEPADPDALAAAVDDGVAVPRLPAAAGDERPAGAHSPEDRARLAEQAMAVVNEHPDPNVRKLYAGQVASHTGLAGRRPGARRRAAHARARRPVGHAGAPVGSSRERRVRRDRRCCCSAGTTSPAGSIEVLFADDVAPPGVPRRRRRPTVDLTRPSSWPTPRPARCSSGPPSPTSTPTPRPRRRNLIAAAVRRELARRRQRNGDPVEIRDDARCPRRTRAAATSHRGAAMQRSCC